MQPDPQKCGAAPAEWGGGTKRFHGGWTANSRIARFDRDDVLARVVLPEIVEAWSGPGRQVGGRWVFGCPVPDHEDAHPSFDVSQHEGVWFGHCRSRCGSFDVFSLVMAVEGLEFPEALAWLADRCGVQPERHRSTWLPSVRSVVSAAPVVRPVPTGAGSVMTSPDAGWVLEDYLAWRGWPGDVAERWGLQVVVRHDLGDKLWIRHPCSDRWWSDRRVAVDGVGPRWLGPKSGTPEPFGLSTIDPVCGFDVYLCEGAADVIAVDVVCRAAGERAQVLGLPGSAGTRQILAQLAAGWPDVMWWTLFDPDEQGDKYRALAAEVFPCGKVAHLRPDPVRDVAQLVADLGSLPVWELLVACCTTALEAGEVE